MKDKRIHEDNESRESENTFVPSIEIVLNEEGSPFQVTDNNDNVHIDYDLVASSRQKKKNKRIMKYVMIAIVIIALVLGVLGLSIGLASRGKTSSEGNNILDREIEDFCSVLGITDIEAIDRVHISLLRGRGNLDCSQLTLGKIDF